MAKICGRDNPRDGATRNGRMLRPGLLGWLLALPALGMGIHATWAQTTDSTQTQERRTNSNNQDSLEGGTKGSDSDSSRPSSLIIGQDPIKPVQITGSGNNLLGTSQQRQGNTLLYVPPQRLKPPAEPGEFENYLKAATGRDIKRFGYDLLLPSYRDYSVPATTTVPPDYPINPGDTISIAITGSVESSADFTVDRDGRVFLPYVGSVNLTGIRYRDLKDRISQALGRKYRGFDVTVGVSQLAGVQVYVTGFANNPGAYNVNSLTTLVNAVLAAGGPSAGGSFRSVKLYRAGREVVDFDLYELIRSGDRSRDPMLHNQDVLFIPPVGRQVAVIGSVNEEAIYEALPGETLADVLNYAGGPNNMADANRAILYRLAERDTVGSREMTQATLASSVAEAGDIVQVLSDGSVLRPLEKQSVVVRIEGEVNRPGNYFVAPNTPLSEVLAQAGGLTDRAFVYGTKLQRESVRSQQLSSYNEAIDQMEMTLAAAPLSADSTTDAGERAAQLAAARAVLDRLRKMEPDGRLVLDIAPTDAALPGNLVLENNDQILVPPRVDTVGVFGAVYRPASFHLTRGQRPTVKDFIDKAGGTMRSADRGAVFVVRANGEVLTKRRGALGARVLPGDVVFVPVKTQSSSLWAKIRDISQIIFQLGLSAATIVAIDR